MDEVVPNRITQFCQNAPAQAVIRAKVGSKDVKVERLYGTPTPTDKLAKHFADKAADDETLLVVENGRHGEGHGFVRLHPDDPVGSREMFAPGRMGDGGAVDEALGQVAA